MANKTTSWILKLVDKVTGPLQKVLDKSEAATKSVDKLQRHYAKLEERASTLTNRLGKLAIAGAAFGFMTLGVLKYDQGMAKINTTAQLTQTELAGVRNELERIGSSSGGNFDAIPEAYEKIISLNGNVKDSLEILEAATMGSKAGFADINVVGGALANTMALVGKENASAMDVLNTFQKAKDLGGGEFEDFANYMPQLISAGKNLGVGYQDVAGVFSFMTAKGNDAAASSMLIQNAFSALLKEPVMKGLQKNGLQLFDEKGSLRGIGSIFSDLEKKMSTMTDQQRANFFVEIGLNDVQARNAFAILTSDSAKLNTMLDGTRNSAGAVETALKNAQNPLTDMASLMDKLKGSINPLLRTFTPLIVVTVKAASAFLDFFNYISNRFPVLTRLTVLFAGLTFGLTTLATVFTLASVRVGMFWAQVQIAAITGTGFTGVLARMTVGMWSFVTSTSASLVRLVVWLGQMIVASTVGLAAFITGMAGATAAQWGLNIAMNANPLGLIVIGVTAVIGVLAVMYNYWDEIVSFIKGFVNLAIEPFPFLKPVILLLDVLLGKFKSIFGSIKSWLGLDTPSIEVSKTETKTEDVFAKVNGDVPAFDLSNGGGSGGVSSVNSVQASKPTSINITVSNNFTLPQNWKDELQNIKQTISETVVGALADSSAIAG